MLQGESLGSGEGQIVSGFEGLSRVKWGNGENEGQSRGSEAGKKVGGVKWGKRSPCGLSELRSVYSCRWHKPTLLEFA